MPVKIFFCYAHEDEALLNQLKRHLSPLRRQGLIELWYDRDISAGTEWEREIDRHLKEAQIILLLVSPDFMDSDYCYGIEMKRAIERHNRKEARVIPIILRPVYWQVDPVGKLQALPKDAKPVTDPDWYSLDRALFNVVEGIRKVVEELIAKPLSKPVKIAEKVVKEYPLIAPVIASVNASQLEVKREATKRRRVPSNNPLARGVVSYTWTTIFLTILLLGLATWTLYFYHLGPFALPSANPYQPAVKVSPTPVIPTPTPTTTPSPCLNLVNQPTDTAPTPSTAAFKQIQHTYKQPPAMTIDTHKVYCAGINTNRGLIVLELDPQLAPKTVNNFVFLAQHHFYDGLKFHRVVAHFIIQTGDPLGDGTGGPGYKFNDEPVLANYTQGCVAMANSGPNTNGSQFFICTADDTKAVQKSYNLFGHVVQGMNVALKIQGPGDDASTRNIIPDVMNHVIVVAAP